MYGELPPSAQSLTMSSSELPKIVLVLMKSKILSVSVPKNPHNRYPYFGRYQSVIGNVNVLRRILLLSTEKLCLDIGEFLHTDRNNRKMSCLRKTKGIKNTC